MYYNDLCFALLIADQLELLEPEYYNVWKIEIKCWFYNNFICHCVSYSTASKISLDDDAAN